MITKYSHVLLPDGTTKCVQELKAGDEILSYNNKVEKILSIDYSGYNGDIYKVKIPQSNIPCCFSDDSKLFFKKRFFVNRDNMGVNIDFKTAKKLKITPEISLIKDGVINKSDFILMTCNTNRVDRMSLLDSKILRYFLASGNIYFKKRGVMGKIRSYVLKFEIGQKQIQKEGRNIRVSDDIIHVIKERLNVKPVYMYKSKNITNRKIVLFYANKKLHDFISKNFIVKVSTREKYYRRHFIESIDRDIFNKTKLLVTTYNEKNNVIKINQAKTILNRFMIPFRYYKKGETEILDMRANIFYNSYYINNNVMLKIKEIKKEKYSDFMYSINTESGYYNCQGIICK